LAESTTSIIIISQSIRKFLHASPQSQLHQPWLITIAEDLTEAAVVVEEDITIGREDFEVSQALFTLRELKLHYSNSTHSRSPLSMAALLFQSV